MSLIFDVKKLPSERRPESAAGWTVIIPAAGHGRRLGAAVPKILYPVLGKPILDWLVGLLEPLCARFVFVLSPEGAPQVTPHVQRLLPERSAVVIQDLPTGMADAIDRCDAAVTTPYALVIWGDQITPRRRTLAACMNVQESAAAVHATIPTIMRENPYIHFERDGAGRVIHVYMARESDHSLALGESDCGVFLFKRDALFEHLRATRHDPIHRGAKTKERNFLSLLPAFDQGLGGLATVRIEDAEETFGINTPEDAQRVEEVLRKRT
jgi:bifunctional UDP-N-acetylglucosamine pyrophosphorylase / glucosamine-1-phosphate N-acetyltransferase